MAWARWPGWLSRCVTLTFSVCLLPVATLCSAAQADHSAPMKLEADSVSHSELQGVSVLIGNVRVEKGSLRLRGQRIEVRQDALGYQKARVLGADAGSGRAYFRQTRDTVAGQAPEHWEGWAQKIDYDSQSAIVTLSGNAHLKRFRGNTLLEEAKAANMVYDDLNERFELSSAQPAKPNTGAFTTGPGGRVQIILNPQK